MESALMGYSASGASLTVYFKSMAMSNLQTKGYDGFCPPKSIYHKNFSRFQSESTPPASFRMKRISSLQHLSATTQGHSIRESHPAHVRDVKLPLELDPERLPKHVAIILDGNNRWAKDRGLSGREGLDSGLHNLSQIVRTCDDWGIEIFTGFQFGYDNWKRSKEEVDALFDLFELHLTKNRDGIRRRNIQFSVLGEVHLFPQSFLNLVKQIEEESRNNKGLKVVIAGGYSGRRDILNACKRIAALVKERALEVDDINEETIESELMTKNLPYPNADLMIRTSGEQRISNFFMWQLAYSELVFVPEKWPAFTPDNLKSALVNYQSRDRRFGARKVKF